jgi:uncharacterized repeat protein (TIGR01451 family)
MTYVPLDSRRSSPHTPCALTAHGVCLLLLSAIIAISLSSCRGPLHSNVAATSDTTLPQSAYSGDMPAAAINDCPSEQFAYPQGVPLAKAAYPPWSPPGIARPWPEDEYLCDGGDGGVPADVKKGDCPDFGHHRGAMVGNENGTVPFNANCREVRGLEMEDAVAAYDTLDGRTLVTPSNRVCIYSPRFAAVRQVVGLVSNEQRQRLSDIQINESLATPVVTQKIGSAKQQVQAENEIGARPAHAFRMKQGDGALSNVIGPRGFQDGFKLYENIRVLRQGIFENTERAILARGVQAAVAWTHDQAVQIILDRKAANAVVQDQQVETIFTVDEPPPCPKLRIIKVASTGDALPGEEVWFTIRFDNVGNQPIGNVTILDSLTTRLEFVEGSAQCSREAKFSVQPNEGDSLVVKCELAEPLEPGRGGLLRFCCKVR